MTARFWKANHQALSFSVVALFIVCAYEACSPMKSTIETANKSLDVCDPMFDPPASLTSKAAATEEKIEFIFSKKKVHLDSKGFSKAKTLQDTKIVVDVDMTCKPAPGSLSEKVLEQNKLETVEFKHHAFTYTIKDASDIADITLEAEADNCVRGVSHDGELRATSLVMPSSNDTNLGNQLHLASINYAHAYEHIVKHSNGTKVKVGFVDTGVDCSHSDLAANLVSGCGFDAVFGLQPTDADGHGTHTLGIVGAVSNNGRGVLGLAGNTATLVAIKVIGTGSGTVADAAEGIQYAIDQNLDVINISLESSSELTQIEQRIQEAVSGGAVVVLAAGNSGKTIGPDSPDIIVSPAMSGLDIDGAITVGSINSDDSSRSYFSNYGSYVEIMAPGSLIDSTNSSTAGLYSTGMNGSYARMMGTSQAAPVVTGAVALLIQFFKQEGIAYTPAKIEQIIKASSDVNSSVGIQGNRVINFSKLTRNAYAVAGIDLCNKATAKPSK